MLLDFATPPPPLSRLALPHLFLFLLSFHGIVSRKKVPADMVRTFLAFVYTFKCAYLASHLAPNVKTCFWLVMIKTLAFVNFRKNCSFSNCPRVLRLWGKDWRQVFKSMFFNKSFFAGARSLVNDFTSWWAEWSGGASESYGYHWKPLELYEIPQWTIAVKRCYLSITCPQIIKSVCFDQKKQSLLVLICFIRIFDN